MNKRGLVVRVIPALLACMASGYAAASGFQLIEQNASGIGNAYAGSAAVAENASTIFYNPAGMTQLQAREFSGGLSAVKPSFQFNNGASTNVGAFANSGGDDGGTLGLIPNAYMSWAVNKDLYLGLGIGAPFGLMTEYKNPWIGAAQSIKFSVKTLNVNPSIAYRANDMVSLGFGLDWQKINAEYKRGVGSYFGAAGNTAGLSALLKLNDNAWGWNAGVLFNVSPATKIGVSYRSAIKYSLTGDMNLSADGSLGSTTTLAALNAQGGSSGAGADLKLPDTWIFSATHKYNDRWEVLGDLSRTGWASIPKIDIAHTDGVANGTVAQSLLTDFRNTWRAALGAKYKLRDDLTLKMGIAYDQTPTKGAATRLVSMPDNNRLWLSFGTQWQPAKGSTLDVGVAYLYLKDAAIHNDQSVVSANPIFNALLQRGVVDGTYSDNAWLLGAQYSVSF